MKIFCRYPKNSPARLFLASSLFLCFGLLSTGFSQDEDGAEAAAASTEESGSTSYQVSTQSEFDEDLQGSRNPFWPIGWQPQEEEVVEKQTIKFERRLLQPSSILMGENPLAIIRRKSYAVGELVPVDLGSQKLLFEITEIRDGAVTFKYGNRTFEVKQGSRY